MNKQINFKNPLLVSVFMKINTFYTSDSSELFLFIGASKIQQGNLQSWISNQYQCVPLNIAHSHVFSFV